MRPLKISIKPTYLDGIAGVKYEIDIELRTQDNYDGIMI